MSSKIVSNSKKNYLSISIGERIKQIREDYGKMKSAFADSLGWSRPQVTKYENNQETPGIEKLIKLSDRYHVNLHWLITGKGEQYISNPYLFIVPGTNIIKDKEGNYQIKNADGSFNTIDADQVKAHEIMQAIYKRVYAADHPIKSKIISILDNVLSLINSFF